ncbi:MAG: biotin--[acetyl-CoA-carboxylase] ligase [Streptosporangiales bacterium]|nr:biotin--[acetyl-CoA-carboxylase] ligase [Streptosporangiales bacterium]
MGDERAPLRADELTAAIVRGGALWRAVRVTPSTASTSADLAAVAGTEAEGLIQVAEFQERGRGRLDRTWQAPPRSALTFSVLLAPADVAVDRWPWLPLLAGVAAVDALADVLPQGAGLKWPNDVLVGDRKVAGILAERVGGALVLGMGLNVSLRADELPVDTATSLLLAGAADVDRTALLAALLDRLAAEYVAWRRAAGDATASGLLDRYRQRCVTLGRAVRVQLPGDQVLDGTAIDVAPSGALLVTDPAGSEHELAAGDVVHVRPTPP